MREDGRVVGGEEWQEKVHNREEWKKLLRTARNRRILHMPMEWMNGNTSTAVEEYQWQFKDDRCLLLGTGGNGKQTWHQNVILLSTTKTECYKQYNKCCVGTWQIPQSRAWSPVHTDSLCNSHAQRIGFLN